MAETAQTVPISAGEVAEAFAERTKAKRERILTFTLVELLTVLVFFAVLYAVVAERDLSDKTKSIDTMRLRNEALESRNRQLAFDLGRASAKLERAESSLARLRAAWEGRQISATPTPLTEQDWSLLEEIAPEMERVLEEQGEGGAGRPFCLRDGFYIFDIALLANGRFAIRRAWAGADQGFVDAITTAEGAPLVSRAIQTGEVTASGLRAALVPIDSWGREREPRCRFRVRAELRHNDARLQLSQQAAIQSANMSLIARDIRVAGGAR